jgi:SAM-dependent methyltransferase
MRMLLNKVDESVAQPAAASRGFSTELLEAVRCPNDGGQFVIVDEHVGDLVSDAGIRCCTCGAASEIRGGILRLLPLQRPLSSLTSKEQDARDRGANRYDAHFSEWSNAVERDAMFGDSSLFRDKVVLDLACGTGRMTVPILGTARAIVAADFSEQSLRVLADKAGAGPKTRLGLVWCDVTQLRLATAFFDAVICAQLLEHIPLEGQRRILLEQVAAGLKSAGCLLLTAYYYNLAKRFLRRPREGIHESGVFFHRFSYAEIVEEMPHSLLISQMKALQIDPRLLPQQSRLRGWLARLLEPIACARVLAHLVLVRAQKQTAA